MDLVEQLLAKIEELQEAKSVIEEERVELDSKLQRATKEMDAFKQRCEELEELSAIGWGTSRLVSGKGGH
jgi:predicted nuclease with TOPRIM domain